MERLCPVPIAIGDGTDHLITPTLVLYILRHSAGKNQGLVAPSFVQLFVFIDEELFIEV